MFETLFSTAMSPFCLFCPLAGQEEHYEQERQRMVQQQIRNRGITDERVLGAMTKINRHLFVPEDLRSAAYGDYPLGIGHGQTISQPYIVAAMTEALGPHKNDKILEIGTGCGYQAAVLAEIVRQVYTIEIVSDLAELARKRLEKLGYRNIWIRYGDGFDGWEDHAPYDGMIVTAAPAEIPRGLFEQLQVGGRMVIPLGIEEQELYVLTKTVQGIQQEKLFAVRFVPMVRGK